MIDTDLSAAGPSPNGHPGSAPDPSLRVAFITDIATPYMVAVHQALARMVDLTVIYCSRSGTRGMEWELVLPFRHEVADGLTISRGVDATDFYLSPKILAAVHRARPQAIISGGFSVPSLYAALFARVRGIPLLIHSDGTAQSEQILGRPHRIAREVLRRLAWGAVANSVPAGARFAEIGFPSERIFHALHATELEPFWQIPAERDRPDSAPMRLLFVGRLIPRKGCDRLLEAYSKARAEGANVELTVVGNGPDEDRLRRMANELGVPVTWRGFVDQPGLPAEYAQADAFAFPTLDDPFGIVVLEAAAASLPSIASSKGGATDDIIRDGINGIVVDPSDTSAMADGIVRLAGDPELRARMGRAACEATRDRTPADSAAGYLQAARAALAQRRG